ncbi:MAG TPA: hypothetical protein VE127_09960, partial [Solirubrobacteraceae bacterium]|nr:hypothetical protein [Solirubrobacteraceae bacterium]
SSGLDANQRVFAFPDVARFETRVVTSQGVEVQLQRYDPSSRTYTPSTLARFDTTGGGLGIATFDPFTLAPSTATRWTADGQAIDWNGVAQALQSAIAAGDGVVIVSLGQMSGFASEPDAAAFQNQVLPAIRKLGGQPDIFARAVNDNDTYSFIGTTPLGAATSQNIGQGAESSSAVLSGRQSTATSAPLPVTAGDLTGELRRGNNGRFLPSQADPSGLYQSRINPVVYQPPTDWPLTPQVGATSATGSEAALAWLAQCRLLPGGEAVVPGLALWPGQDCSTDTGGSTPVAGTPSVAAVRQVALSLRTDYYDNATLSLNDISSLSYQTLFPAGNNVFSASDFQAAQDQLTRESGDVAAAKQFFTTLTSVISDSQASLTLSMVQVASDVRDAYFNSQQLTVTDYDGEAKGMFEGFVTAGATVASLFGGEFGVEQLFETAELFSDLGNYSQMLVNGPETSVFSGIESWLMLDQQLQNTSVSVDEAVTNSVSLQKAGLGMAQAAVLSDWGRLDTVAANSAGPWSVSENDLTDAGNAFVISTRQQIWQGYAHQLWKARAAGQWTASQFFCNGPDQATSGVPFLGAVQTGFPTGLGNGIQYWPLQTIATVTATKLSYPTWRSYIMWEPGTTQTPPVNAVSAIFQQPTSTGAGYSSAGAYGPWFWPAAFDLTKKFAGCDPSLVPGSEPSNFYGQTG